MNDSTPSTIMTPPIAIIAPPSNESGINDRSNPGSFMVLGMIDGMKAPAATRTRPPPTIIRPPMILRTAIIVTPVGRGKDDPVGLDSKFLLSFFHIVNCRNINSAELPLLDELSSFVFELVTLSVVDCKIPFGLRQKHCCILQIPRLSNECFLFWPTS